MIKALIERLRQKERTIEFPGGTPVLPERFRGLPAFGAGRLPAGSPAQCPVGAISEDGPVSLDLGKCIFCGRCEKFSGGAISFGRDYRLAVSDRRSLSHRGGELALARALDKKSRALFGRSLKLRQG
ncbi:MAG: hypothetical protein PHP45_09675, partial [Elusimicrobiales bacterium]|nr:hypothetical protein [Elusimicrobiales bacterium]